MIRADRYAADAFARLPDERRLAIEASVPAGHDLYLTHGGRLYTARVTREGELVDAVQRARLDAACEAVLARVAA